MILKEKVVRCLLVTVIAVQGVALADESQLVPIVTAERLISVLAPGLAANEGKSQGSEAEFSRGIGGIRTGFADPTESSPESGTNQSDSGGNLLESSQASSRADSRVAFDNLFETGSYNLSAGAYRQLDEIGRALHVIMFNDSSATFTIAGYSSGPGSAQNNKMLSERMAVAVANYLVGKLWLDDRRLTVVGHGAEKAGAANQSGRASSGDGRVEIVAN